MNRCPFVFTVDVWACHKPDSTFIDSAYTERFWLPTVGPTALLTARRFVADLQRNGWRPVKVDTVDLAPDLGVKPLILRRAVTRLVDYGLARWTGDETLEVLFVVPRLAPRRYQRLSPHLQAEHDRLTKEST